MRYARGVQPSPTTDRGQSARRDRAEATSRAERDGDSDGNGKAAHASGSVPSGTPGGPMRTTETTRYKTDAFARPPTRAMRSLKAYWVTFRVISSYLLIRFQARFRSKPVIERKLAAAHLKNAKRIEQTILSLQGLFIKVGQLISIMTNFLPEQFRKQLEGLQDAVPPRPYADVEKALREELGKGPDELFAHFERRPIASASIGQVHLARMHDGMTVAVKVQYPDIEEIVKADLATLERIFRITGRFVHYQGMEDVYREIRTMILEELDFRAEAEHATLIAANFADQPEVAFPQVIAPLSTARVLTTKFETGVKISDCAGLARLAIDRGVLARRVVEVYCQQIFTDGVYHADPHPGNILVRPSGSPDNAPCIVFLDFGAVARISPEIRNGIVELIQGALTRDTQRIVAAMKTMGFVARGADDRVFEQVVEYFHARFQEQISLDSFNLRDIKFDPEKGLENLADLRKMDITLRELSENFHVPKEFILLQRTLLLLMGLCTELDPTMNPMTVIRPYLERFVLGDEGDWSTFVVNTTRDLVMSVAALPSDLRKVMRLTQAGELQVRFRNLERTATLMYRLGHQMILVCVGIAGAAIAVVYEGRGDFDRASYGWWTTGVCAGLFVLSLWTSRRLLRRR
jgi:ubiquinone biosynthesis protein